MVPVFSDQFVARKLWFSPHCTENVQADPRLGRAHEVSEV